MELALQAFRYPSRSGLIVIKRAMSQSVLDERKTIGIIGGGIAGPVFALQILTHPQLSSLYKPIVFEQCRETGGGEGVQSAGAAIGLSPNGLYPLYQLGLKKAIEEASYDMEGMSIWRVHHDDRREARDGERAGDAKACPHKLLSRLVNLSWAEDVQSNMRVMERGKLMDLLNERVKDEGGEIQWGKRCQGLQDLGGGRTRVIFEDEGSAELDLLIGAEGAWSLVRRYILESKYGKEEGTKKWVPKYQRASNIYGISALSDCKLTEDEMPKHALDDTHGCWLTQGALSSSALPGGVIRWDLQLPEAEEPPEPISSNDVSETSAPADQVERWISKITPGIYPLEHTIKLLRDHADIYHPVTGTFGRMLAASDRIFHSPLRQQVWEEDDIQHGNIVLIGDAARLIMPCGGQGTSFAVEDATVLAECLLQHPLEPTKHENLEQGALKEYAKKRVPRSKQMATYTGYTCEAGLARTWYWRALRDTTSFLSTFGSNK